MSWWRSDFNIGLAFCMGCLSGCGSDWLDIWLAVSNVFVGVSYRSGFPSVISWWGRGVVSD